ncbi:MAG: IS66 family transposase [Planctomycetes bacterium]|nr:IS66 family transposase [Planctomycetota bacterium]
MQPGKAKSVGALIDAAVRGKLSRAQALRLCKDNPEVITLALLAAGKRIAEQAVVIAGLHEQARGTVPSPSTPSGMVPIYTKPNTPKRRQKSGAKQGHPGHRRTTPERIDERETHRLKRCPHCDGRLQRCQRSRTRIIEDIPEEIHPVVTEHTIHRDYCPKCKKHVEPVVPDALSHATIGHHLNALTSWLHYGLGVTIDQIVDILGYHLQTKLTPGGLIDGWRRLSEILLAWYERIAEDAKNSTYLHADETGWRINGQGCWLWCFTNDRNCYYMIEYCRGSPVLQKFFTEAFEGVLITDFWAAYDSVDAADRQKCLPHLLRELEKVDLRNNSAEWHAFAKRLRRLLRDGIRLRKRTDFAPGKFQSRIDRLNRRVGEMAREEHADADTRRLTKRLRRYGEYLFTFLDYSYVPHDNNFGERQIRPAVILRKNSQSNRSDRGAATQAVLMSVYRTLKLRGLNPTKTIADALKTYLTTGILPPLPE